MTNIKAFETPLSPILLRETIDLCLWAGQLLLQSGADSDRVESTVHYIGTGLGCNWLDVFVSASALAITVNNGTEFRTKIRRVVRVGTVNLNTISAINDLSYQVHRGELAHDGVRQALQKIDKAPRHYNLWLTAMLVGLGCGAFSKLFGGDWWVFAATSLAAMLATLVRQQLTHRYFNPLLIIVVTAFVGAGTVAIIQRLLPNIDFRIAFAASVVGLVPGVQLINALEDLLTGHSNMGVARGLNGFMISFNIAIGITIAIRLFGIQDLWQTLGHPDTFWLDGVWAATVAICFGALFNLAPRWLIWAALCGAIAHGSRYLLANVVGLNIATLLAASMVGVLGMLLAHQMRVPSISFTLPAAITMVPGTVAFSAMIGALTLVGELTSVTPQSDLLLQTAISFMRVGILLGAIATGVTLPTLVFRRKPVV